MSFRSCFIKAQVEMIKSCSIGSPKMAIRTKCYVKWCEIVYSFVIESCWDCSLHSLLYLFIHYVRSRHAFYSRIQHLLGHLQLRSHPDRLPEVIVFPRREIHLKHLLFLMCIKNNRCFCVANWNYDQLFICQHAGQLGWDSYDMSVTSRR